MVKGNTDLKGAVIESTQTASDAGRNTLTTASLTHSDMTNHADYDAQSVSAGVSSSGVAPPTALNANGHDTSTTQSGVSSATLTLTSKDKPTSLASLNRTVKTGKDTSGAIKNNLDVNEIQTGFAVTQAFVQQANTFVASQAQKAEQAKAALKAEQAKPANQQDPAKIASLTQAVDDGAKWDAGGTYRQIATALTAAAGGNVTGSMNALVQGAAVNYLQSLGASEVKKIADSLKDKAGSETARAALHGILACGGAAAQGSDCGSAALGAGAGSVINTLMAGDPAKMTAAEKESRKNLVASLVMGIAATAGSSNIAAASSAAQIETENNAVYVSGHLAGGKAGKLTTPESNHLSIVLIPDNPEDFKGQEGWQSRDDGSLVSTIGGQPKAGDKLINLESVPNNQNDGLGYSTYLQGVPTPDGQTDTQFISNLRAADRSYGNTLPYSVPTTIVEFWSSNPTGYMSPNEYNSNSYTAGIIKAAGGTPPFINTGGDFQVPGYTNPIPLPFSAGSVKRRMP